MFCFLPRFFLALLQANSVPAASRLLPSQFLHGFRRHAPVVEKPTPRTLKAECHRVCIFRPRLGKKVTTAILRGVHLPGDDSRSALKKPIYYHEWDTLSRFGEFALFLTDCGT